VSRAYTHVGEAALKAAAGVFPDLTPKEATLQEKKKARAEP